MVKTGFLETHQIIKLTTYACDIQREHQFISFRKDFRGGWLGLEHIIRLVRNINSKEYLRQTLYRKPSSDSKELNFPAKYSQSYLDQLLASHLSLEAKSILLEKPTMHCSSLLLYCSHSMFSWEYWLTWLCNSWFVLTEHWLRLQEDRISGTSLKQFANQFAHNCYYLWKDQMCQNHSSSSVLIKKLIQA